MRRRLSALLWTGIFLAWAGVAGAEEGTAKKAVGTDTTSQDDEKAEKDDESEADEAKPAKSKAAKAESAEEEPAEPAPEKAAMTPDEKKRRRAELARQYGWETAGGRYVDPTSFFSLHGYIDGVFAADSKEWTAADPAQVGMPGQLLVPNTNNSSFQQDLALFVGSEISPVNRVLLELHLVTDPSGGGAAGPGGLTIAWTEAVAAWDIVPTYLTLSGGLYWAPFGIVNQDWLGAQNLFTLMPRASAAFPAHWNERGVRLNGAVPFSEKTGLNYVVSVGNGVKTFDIMGQPGFDPDTNKAVMGRVGVFPGLGGDLDVGYSLAAVKLRGTPDPAGAPNSALTYPSDLIAHGIDATYRRKNLQVRAYIITSQETLEGVPGVQDEPAALVRNGAVAEAVYVIRPSSPIGPLGSIAPKVRVDWFQNEMLTADGSEADAYETGVYSLGVNLYPAAEFLFRSTEYPYENFYVSLEYHVQNEFAREELENDRFIGRITGRF